MMRLAILGAPGSGKGIQAKLLAARYRVIQLSNRQLLYTAARSNDKLAQQIKQSAASEQTPADQAAIELLDTRLRARDSKRGFIIDDFPRNIPQAQAFDALLGMLGRALQIALYIQVDEATLAKRLAARLACGQCGALYNLLDSPPKTSGKCDNCNGELLATHSGSAKDVAAQVNTYHEETAVLNTYYKAQHKLRTVLSNGDAAETQKKICDLIDLEFRPLEITIEQTAVQASDPEINTVIAGGQVNRITVAPQSRPPPRRAATTNNAAAPRKVATSKKQVVKKNTTRKTTKKTVSGTAGTMDSAKH